MQHLSMTSIFSYRTTITRRIYFTPARCISVNRLFMEFNLPFLTIRRVHINRSTSHEIPRGRILIQRVCFARSIFTLPVQFSTRSNFVNVNCDAHERAQVRERKHRSTRILNVEKYSWTRVSNSFPPDISRRLFRLIIL